MKNTLKTPIDTVKWLLDMPKDIQKCVLRVCNTYGISHDELYYGRDNQTVLYRYIVFFKIRSITKTKNGIFVPKYTFEYIGGLFSLNYSTVICGVKLIKTLYGNNKEIKSLINKVMIIKKQKKHPKKVKKI